MPADRGQARSSGPPDESAASAARKVGLESEPALLRAGIALTRGLLLDLIAGAEPREVDAAHAVWVDLIDRR